MPQFDSGAAEQIGRFSEGLLLRLLQLILDLQKSVSTLGWLVACAELHGLSYGILPLDREAQWLPEKFDPKTS